ncbi:MAG: hypothetical protein ABIH00_09590, partial [Armatimonadota bacterium]
LFPVKDSKKLAQAVIKVLKKNPVLGSLQENGKDYILKNFNVKRAAGELAEIYDNMRKRR